MSGLLVALATYNEADNIHSLVSAILEVVPDAHVVIIDDNSTDGTGRIADDVAREDLVDARSSQQI